VPVLKMEIQVICPILMMRSHPAASNWARSVARTDQQLLLLKAKHSHLDHYEDLDQDARQLVRQRT
jgi:hypothetical protein